MNHVLTNLNTKCKDTLVKRNQGIDLLKVIAMFMIVGSHILQQGLNYANIEPFTIKWYISNFVMALLICHVNVYALISGYVKAGQKNRLYKAFSLWIIVFFYSIISYFVQIINGSDQLSIMGLAKCFALFISGRYWYFTAYCGLLVIAPFLVKIIDQTDICSCRKLVYGAIVVWGLGGWLGGLAGAGKIIGAYEGFSTIWLSILYCVGYAISKYGEQVIFFHKKRFYIIVYFVSGFIVFISSVVLRIMSLDGYLFFYNYLCPFVLLEAISLLCLFRNMNIDNFKICKTITTLSRSTFGIYIIHTTPLFVGIVYPVLNKMAGFWISWYLLVLLVSTFVIFLVSFLIELCREKIFYFFKIDSIAKWINIVINKVITTIFH